MLRSSHYSRTILSNMMCYGADYDFCEFYELIKSGKRAGVICCLNGSMTADVLEGASVSSCCIREISEFLRFKYPYSAQMPQEMLSKTGMSEYQKQKRYFFYVPPDGDSSGIDINPDPEYVFKTAFDGQNESYGIWLTDTLRRRNMDLTRLYGYNGSVLTVRFRIGEMAYISEVATPLSERGKGYARKLLGMTAFEMQKEGYNCYLCADEHSSGYYRKLGYEEIGSDYTLKLKDKIIYE